MRKTGHLQALSYGAAEPLPVSPLLGASNRHSSPLWRTWGQQGLQVKRHSVLSSLLRWKCHKTEGRHSWKVLWKESLLTEVWAVTGLCGQTSKRQLWVPVGFLLLQSLKQDWRSEKHIASGSREGKTGMRLAIHSQAHLGLWWLTKTWLHTWVFCSSSFCRSSTGEDRLEVGNLRNK